ncbi:amino acid adenylation domain-containing protein [Pseudanabaena sp. FACHB-2040]|nr:amino acid adenylation domain-containing protein [Pseudanabaena sp. FACHB-2040]
MFEAQAKQTPDAVAVTFNDLQLTYQQLNQRANQLAHYLRAIGVGLETLVGLYEERSLDMLVGLLGILKAGGSYVPLDPAYPSERLAFILQDTQAPVILTRASLSGSLPPHQAKVICLDTDWNRVAKSPSENPICVADSSTLMYTIYTSGSTGQPKGVMITHGSIYNQLHWRQTTFPLSAADRVLQNISLSFDPSVWQIFWPLSFGAQLVLPRPGGQQDVAYLVQLIAQQQVSVIALVPSLLRVFLEAKGLDQCRSLKHVFCGGEALTLDLQERFFERFSADTLLHNVYGPTEAAIDATYWTCDRNRPYPIAPIGQPILNAQVYVLDDQLQPLPAGEAGELHIGGAGLARGYLNRPDLTAEKFITNPFRAEPSERLYKTGDLVSYLPDGNIEFLGRIDHQVKVRGFRIELEEIEATLTQHPDVQQSVVAAWENTPGDKRLVAYFVSEQSNSSVGDLRAWLQARLPDYMVPAAFVQLKALPLNPNGKVDRRALPTPGVERPAVDSSWVAPQNQTEHQLIAIWEEVLQVQPIGVQDNFFDLGGNSLLATALFTKIERVLGRELPVSLLFDYPTVGQLANFLQQGEQTVQVRSLVAIRPGQAKPPLFCMHTRTGQIFEYYGLTKYLEADQPVYGLQPTPTMRGQAPSYQPLEEMAADYIQDIRSLQPNGPYFLCGYSFGGLLAYEIAQQLSAQGQPIALLVLIDAFNTPQPWFGPIPLHTKVAVHLKNLKPLSLKERVAYLWNRAWKLDEANPSPELLAQRANEQYFERVAQNYRPQPYAGQAVLFKATQLPSEYHLKPTPSDPHLGWSELVGGSPEIETFPCNHFRMFEEPTLAALAAKLQVYLKASQLRS